MIENSNQSANSDAAFEFKGGSFTLPVLHLYQANMDLVSQQLAEKVNQAPDFFQNAPVVIDLQRLQEGAGGVDFALLVGLLRGFGMIPVGVRGGSDEQNGLASAMELAILSNERVQRQRAAPRSAPPSKSEEVDVPALEAASKLITRPVRSGQRVFAPGGDLIIVAAVGSGAEVIAAGNIHVYGSLRGRALAGVKGDTGARIFCQGLEAELVSVAGHYRISEDIDEAWKSKSVQILLSGRRLEIQPL